MDSRNDHPVPRLGSGRPPLPSPASSFTDRSPLLNKTQERGLSSSLPAGPSPLQTLMNFRHMRYDSLSESRRLESGPLQTPIVRSGSDTSPLLRDELLASGIDLDGRQGVLPESRKLNRKLSRAQSGFATLRSLTSVGDGDSWRYKYEHFMAAMPALDDATFGAGKREFYRRQRDLLEGFREADRAVGNDPQELTADEIEQLKKTERGETFAVKASNYVNLLLFIAKVQACLASGSLAIIASTLDSLLDLVAGFILWFTAQQMSAHQPDKYPVGKKRMQPVGIIVFAAIMATLGLQIMMEGLRQLVAGDEVESKLTRAEEFWLIAVLGGATAVKGWLFLYCRRFDNEIVQAYAQDHFFDVATNTVSLLAALVANRYQWWIDPLGAIAISVYTIVNWGKTVLENAVSLVCTSAPPELIGKLTYVVYNHHHLVRRIWKIQAWSFGSLYWVEVSDQEVVLRREIAWGKRATVISEVSATLISSPPLPLVWRKLVGMADLLDTLPDHKVDIQFDDDILLRDAQTIGQDLKDKLEKLQEIERAFVQLCFEERRKPSDASSPQMHCVEV